MPLTIKLHPQVVAMTGFTEEEITAAAEKVLAEDTTPLFDDEDTRTVELRAAALGYGEKSITLGSTFQFIGLHDNKAWFLRASKSQAERESAAVDTAINALMAVKDGAKMALPMSADVLDEAAALIAAQDEVDNGDE